MLRRVRDIEIKYYTKVEVPILLRVSSLPISFIPFDDCSKWCDKCPSWYNKDPNWCRKPGGGCLTGDTKISLLNGTEVPIKSLVGVSEFWVYSCTPEGKIVPGRGHSARVTKKVVELCKVTLDNDESVKCTNDHLWMLRDGTYKMAKDLAIGESLMPLYRRYNTVLWNSCGYEEVQHPLDYSWEFTHQRVVWSLLGGYKGKKRVAHHIDFNKRNNSPTNLSVLSVKDHWRLHSAVCSERNKDPEFAKIVSNGVRRAWKYNQGFRNSVSESTKKDWDLPGYRDRMSLKAREAWNLPGYKERMSEKARKEYVDDSTGFRSKLTKQNRTPVVCEVCGKSLGNVGALGRHNKTHVVNHKVVRIEVVYESVEVYDISVEKYENFALSSGVFVHNCPPNSPKGENIRSKHSWAYFIGGRFDGSQYPEKVRKNAGQMFRTLNYLSSPFMVKVLNHLRRIYPFMHPLGLGSCWACRPKGCAVKIGKPCVQPLKRMASMEAVGIRADLILSNLFPDFTWKRGNCMFRLVGLMLPNGEKPYDPSCWGDVNLTPEGLGDSIENDIKNFVGSLGTIQSDEENSLDFGWNDDLRAQFDNLYSGVNLEAIHGPSKG